MKKIERLGDNGGDVVFVYASDLDEQERYIAVLEESRENTVKMLKTVLEMLDTKTCL